MAMANKLLFTGAEVSVLIRFFVRLEQQIERASREGRSEDVVSLCRLAGALQYRITETSMFEKVAS
jgi:hypothetical protein